MKYKYRDIPCTFRQFISAYIATAIGDEHAILAMAALLIQRDIRCMMPTVRQARQIEHDTLGQCVVVWEGSPPPLIEKKPFVTPVRMEKARGEGENAVYHLIGFDHELIGEVTSIKPEEASFLEERINRE